MASKAEFVGYVFVTTLVALLTVGEMSVSASSVGNTGPSGPGPSSGHDAPSGPHGGSSHPIWPGATAASCGFAPALPDPDAYSDPGDAVKALSRTTSEYLRTCDCPVRTCLADALDNYAEALAKVAPRLPPRLRDMSSVVAKAAHRVRTAHSKAEAEAAFSEAIAHIHKEIELIRVEDADKQERLTRSGNFVVGTLETAKSTLERADAL